MPKPFKIKNKNVVGLANWLNSLALGGKESRERTRFVKILSDHSAEVDAERIELAKKFSNTDKSGNPLTKKDGDKEIYDLDPSKMEEFVKEFNELMDEEFVMDVLEGNKSKLQAVKDLVLNTSYVFGPSEGDSNEERIKKVLQAQEYDVWCESFEAVEI